MNFYHIFAVICIVPTVVFKTSSAQSVATRTCSSTTSSAGSRCSVTSATAAARCAAFCASTSVAASPLKTYYCGTTGSSCAVTSYCLVAPVTSTCGNPTIGASTSNVVVPCGLARAQITGTPTPQITGLSAACGPYFINQQVVSSTNGDLTANYLIFNADGTISQGLNVPSVNTTQTIAITAFSTNALNKAVYSNTINVTFQIASCALQIVCPSAITYCASVTCGFAASCKYQQNLYNELTCQVLTALPSGTTVVWDVPGALGATVAQQNAGFLPSPGSTCTTPGQTCLNSPQVLVSANNDPGIYISNYNLLINGYQTGAGSLIGIYGLSTNNGGGTPGQVYEGVPQTLLISASVLQPTTGTPLPYTVGTATVTTTVSPNAGNFYGTPPVQPTCTSTTT